MKTNTLNDTLTSKTDILSYKEVRIFLNISFVLNKIEIFTIYFENRVENMLTFDYF